MSFLTSCPAVPPSLFCSYSRLGLPFIDRPVNVETLASAAVEALLDSSVSGVQDWRGMEKLAESYKSNKQSRTTAVAGSIGGGGSEL